MNLKIREADLQALKSAVAPYDTQDRRQRYLDGDFPYAQGCKDRDMRYRWDLVHASGLRFGDGRGMPGDLNLYASQHRTELVRFRIGSCVSKRG